MNFLFQLSTVQIEMKSFKCQNSESSSLENNNRITESVNGRSESYYHHQRHAGHRVDERLASLERKISIVARKRGILEKRVVYENQDELKQKILSLEKSQSMLGNRVENVSKQAEEKMGKVEESIIRVYESLENIEEKFENNKSEEKRELSKLEVNAAKKYAELSLTREELVNLRRTVQALSVSASKLQEKSDLQRDSITSLKSSLVNVTRTRDLEAVSSPLLGLEGASGITKELERAEDDYRTMIESLPANCEEHHDGLTMLAPGGQALPLLVSCHRGWIVIGRRIDGTVDFDRKWNEYAEGFGSPLNELWLGNEAIHRLTRDNCTRLGIDLVDIYGNRWRAEYENFRVDSDETGYRMSVSGYSGNATDAFSYQNGMAFSAKDKDMDTSSSDCAANYRGGWWFSHCQHANLNGRYSLGLAWYRADTNQWMAVVSAVMSIQRKQHC